MLNNLRYCYNFKLGSGCNSGKDLSKSEDNDQLVKCKATTLYIYRPWENRKMSLRREMRKI